MLRRHPPPRSAIPEAATYMGTVAEVDLWRVDLDRPVAGAAGILAREERDRAGRFAFERDRIRFVAGRAAVRAVLAGYLGGSPAGLAFCHGAHGKPCLASGPPFSYSSSQGRGLIGVGGRRELGVDLERLRDVPDAAGIVASFFAPEERAAWERAAGDRSAAFLRLWTRKEAALKALGVGLSGAGGGEEAARVEIHELTIDPEHAASLAVVIGG